MGIVNGLKQLLKSAKNSTKNGLDHFWLGEEGQKAIRDEVTKKFKPKIDRAHTYESKRAENIKDLDAKVKQSKEDLANAQKDWKAKYDSALADAKTQRQTDIDNYNTQLKAYSDALTDAKAGKQSILDQLRASEAQYDPYNTIFTDVNTGKNYIYNPFSGYRSLDSLTKKEKKDFRKNYRNFDNRLIDFSTNPSGKVINAFDESNKKIYKGNNIFDSYYPNKINAQDAAALRDAENQIKLARNDLTTWQQKSAPTALDEKQFLKDYNKTIGKSPTDYSFNGQTYSKEADLNQAYKDALAREQKMQARDSGIASRYASKQDAEIAQRIQDAKDMNKAKVALGLGTAGALAGATYAAFSGDDNSNTKPASPTVTPQTTEGIETQFEHPAETDSISGISPRDQEAALADMAFKAASESDDTPAETHPETPELAELSADDIHTNEGIGTRRSMNEGLFSVIKALQDPHQANAVADYIYSRYGNDPELQQLGWRAWLNKYYGDALRSQMNLDASGYNSMHIA